MIPRNPSTFATIAIAAMAWLGLVSLMPATAIAQDIHEADRISSTNIIYQIGFELDDESSSFETVPSAFIVDGSVEAISSVWACIPDGIELSIRVGEDATALAEEAWMELTTDHGSEDAPLCPVGEITEATWVGSAELVQLRVDSGEVDLLADTTVYGRSTTDQDDPDTVAGRIAENTVSIIDGDLEIVTREGWGANESYRNAPNDDPNSDRADHITIHHSAGINEYSETEVVDLVQGIYESHTVGGNGWNDIGYNFLIDRFGTVYEGRVGSLGTDGKQGFLLESPTTTGIHNGGFNTASVGIAMLGTHSQTDEDGGEIGEPISDAARESLLDLVTVISGVQRIDLNTVVTRTCTGETVYCVDGQLVTPRLTYHRAFSATACPGGHAVDQLFGGHEYLEIDYANGEGIADSSTGALETAPTGSLREEFNLQPASVHLAWINQLLQYHLDNPSSEAQQEEVLASHLTEAELKRRASEIERLVIATQR